MNESGWDRRRRRARQLDLPANPTIVTGSINVVIPQRARAQPRAGRLVVPRLLQAAGPNTPFPGQVWGITPRRRRAVGRSSGINAIPATQVSAVPSALRLGINTPRRTPRRGRSWLEWPPSQFGPNTPFPGLVSVARRLPRLRPGRVYPGVLPSTGIQTLYYLSLREAIIAWLNGQPMVTYLVGTRIYWEDPSQLAAYPCVVVEVLNRDYGHNLAGADGTSTATVQITAISQSEAASVAIVEAIRNFMDGFRGIQSGVPILSCLLEDEADSTTPPPDGSDNWIYQVAIEYRVKHRVTFPSLVTQTNV